MLKRIAEDIWAQENHIALPAGMSLPCRATIMRLPTGGLVIHSPLAIDDATAKEIDALGDVRFIVAPNGLHWMFLKAAKSRYPQARVFGSPVLAKKLGDFAFEHLPERGGIDGMDGVRIERIQGAPRIQEHVFLHETSRSLLVTDLVFNVHECRSFLMRFFLRIGGTWKKTAQSLEWRFLVKDRPAAAQSASEVLTWDFERVVVGHGEVVEDDARERARRALAWMTSATPPLLGTGSVAM
ncbi:MAG TPA: DUF4336 domain-containing protein [Labilithrix sp.]|nr:DUF4336 domain-containing protein [Labilithrix sp.]